ncbi:unnamed protein product [Mesocestoides corti]|uniref:PHTF1/2 N-terminal domain-containing protein n=1 Tax=Mesocestoides corti TaxID=53468 RepID=A0A0R3ULJ3_MESCO|nr:unnamed protein product [Mesocestoides corti]
MHQIHTSSEEEDEEDVNQALDQSNTHNQGYKLSISVPVDGDYCSAISDELAHRRRAYSLKVPHHFTGEASGGGGGASLPLRAPSSGAEHDADVESDQEDNEACRQRYLRKRSASLSPDFCFKLSQAASATTPLEEDIKRFKEAKMRGIPDPEVFAKYRSKQLKTNVGGGGQQLSPRLKNTSKWMSHLPDMLEAGAMTIEAEEEKEEEEDDDDDGGGDESEDEEPHNLAEGEATFIPHDFVYIRPHNANFASMGIAHELVTRPIEYLDMSRHWNRIEPDLSQNSNSNDKSKARSHERPDSSKNGIRTSGVSTMLSNEGDNGISGLKTEELEKQKSSAEDEEFEATDTFNTRRRQRAKFLRLFWERACSHRHQQRPPLQAPHVSTAVEETLRQQPISCQPGVSGHWSPDGGSLTETSRNLHLAVGSTTTSKKPVTQFRSGSNASQKRAAAQVARAKVISFRPTAATTTTTTAACADPMYNLYWRVSEGYACPHNSAPSPPSGIKAASRAPSMRPPLTTPLAPCTASPHLPHLTPSFHSCLTLVSDWWDLTNQKSVVKGGEIGNDFGPATLPKLVGILRTCRPEWFACPINPVPVYIVVHRRLNVASEGFRVAAAELIVPLSSKKCPRGLVLSPGLAVTQPPSVNASRCAETNDQTVFVNRNLQSLGVFSTTAQSIVPRQPFSPSNEHSSLNLLVTTPSPTLLCIILIPRIQHPFLLKSMLNGARRFFLAQAHAASETECDRMNSDLGSEYDSSSVSDEERLGSRGHLDQLPAAAAASATTQPSSASEMPATTSSTRHAIHHHHHPTFALHVRTVGLDDAVGSSVSPTNLPDVSPKHGGGGAGGVGGGGGVSGDLVDEDAEDPFALWYMRAFQGISDPSSGPLETVWCYIWEGRKLKKVNLTLLDIGWSIIQAVERQTVSLFYPKLSCVLALQMALLPLVFHAWYSQSPEGAHTTPSVPLGPWFETDLVRSRRDNHSRNPLDTPGVLALSLYYWISDLVTKVFFASPEYLNNLVGQNMWFRGISLDRLVIGLGIWLRLNIYGVVFFLLCVAERSFQQASRSHLLRLLYAKHFFALTSSHRARKCRIPHFRLNKVAHVKCWLTLRSYLKKQGPQRSIECIITAAFYLAFAFGLFFCAQVRLPRVTQPTLQAAMEDSVEDLDMWSVPLLAPFRDGSVEDLGMWSVPRSLHLPGMIPLKTSACGLFLFVYRSTSTQHNLGNGKSALWIDTVVSVPGVNGNGGFKQILLPRCMYGNFALIVLSLSPNPHKFLMGKPSRRSGVFSSLATWDILAYTASVSVFLLRFLTLGTKITKKYRNVSVLITEQMNLYLSMEKKPHKKEEFSITNQVLRLAENLLKEVDGPYRICGWAVNPLVYNVFKLVLLSCFSAFISEFLGFKLKLYKLKLNPANW